ncbi:MAG TPA: DUF192 domain-containing protein [Clostridium sp.]
MVKNLIYNLEIIAEIFIADSFIKRFLGFMFREKPHHEAILIKPCNSIHTFFMRFPIDVLFINENMEVVKKIDGLKPGRIIMPQKKCKMVIEGKAGMFKTVKVGKKIIVLS